MLDNKYREPVPHTMPTEARQIPDNKKMADDNGLLGVNVYKPIANGRFTAEDIILKIVDDNPSLTKKEIARLARLDVDITREILLNLRKRGLVSIAIQYVYMPVHQRTRTEADHASH